MDPTPVAELNKLLNNPALEITYIYNNDTRTSGLRLSLEDTVSRTTRIEQLTKAGVDNTQDENNDVSITSPLLLKRIAGLSFYFLDKLSDAFKKSHNDMTATLLRNNTVVKQSGLHGISTELKTKWFEQYFGFNEIGIRNTKLNVLLRQHKYDEKESCFDFSDITFTIKTENYRQDYKIGDF